VNTRLQVEHPVTEAVTGLDLVRWQILVAAGEPLPLPQDALTITGHAIEARLYAEDPANDFLPSTGRVAIWEPAELPGVRYDSGVAAGTVVGVHYDPLLAKIIAHGATRAQATARLVAALRRLGVAGVTTNRDLLLAVLTHPAFAEGALDTHFIDRHLPPTARTATRDSAADRVHAAIAALAAHERRRRAGGPLPPSIPSGWLNNRWRPQEQSFRVGDDTIDVRYVATAPGEFDVEAANATLQARVIAADADRLVTELDGVRRRFTVATDGDTTFVHGPLGTATLVALPRFPTSRREEIAGGCLAPMPGIIRQVRVAAGDHVEKGTIMLVLEAMKMEHQMIASDAGTVREVRVEVGQMVDPDTVMIIVDADAAEATAQRGSDG
jgi:propionyl-CoA carboxylase alpha chain